MKLNTAKPHWRVVALFLASCSLAQAGEQTLHDEILAMDKKLFDAFNDRDIETTEGIFAADLEFYHDTGGVGDYAQTIANIRQLFEADNGLTRTLIVESTTVYPVAGYGAIQVGKHRFCHPENGKMDCGVFDFVHIWKKIEDTWKLARVVSYGH